MKVIVGWSGGKDSQACLIWAKEKFGADNVEAAFCNTKWEKDVTYRHVELIPQMLGIELTILQSKKYDGFADLAIKKGRMPSTTARFCTEELKTKPMIDYILSQRESVLVIQGQRADESAKRAKLDEQCRYFKYYFEPYQTNTMIVELLSIKKTLTPKQRIKLNKAKQRLSEGKEDPKFHTYRKKEVFEWCEKYADDTWRPIFTWDAQKTISYSLDRGIPLNPLYYFGFTRIGCYPCIMCTKKETKWIVDNDPERIEEIGKLEGKSSAFFSADEVPLKYRRQTTSTGKKYCSIYDVVDYIKDKNATGDLFAEIEKQEKESSGRRCMSAYSICE